MVWCVLGRAIWEKLSSVSDPFAEPSLRSLQLTFLVNLFVVSFLVPDTPNHTWYSTSTA